MNNDEKKARDEAAYNYRLNQCNYSGDTQAIVNIFKSGADWQAKRDIRHTYKSEIYTESISNLEMADNVNESSAEFPEKEFELWFNTPLPDRSCRTICKYWFERGRLSNVDERDQNRRLANRNADLNDKLEEANAEKEIWVKRAHAMSEQIDGLKEAIAKIKGEKK